MHAIARAVGAQIGADALNKFINLDFKLSADCVLRSDLHGRAPAAIFTTALFGNVDVIYCEGVGERVSRRTIQSVRANPVDDILVVITHRANTTVQHCGRSSTSEPEGFVCLSSLKPWISHTLPQDGGFAATIIKIPAPILRSHLPNIDDRCNLLVNAQAGAGRMMLNLVRDALEQSELLKGQQRVRTGELLIAAVVNAVLDAPEFQQADQAPCKGSRDRVFEKAETFITANLSSPSLNSELLAAHCGVSVRYLDLCFAARGLTVCNYIRSARLAKCRVDLIDEKLNGKTITEICMRWGFNDPAHFSRAYRRRFGRSPRQERPDYFRKAVAMSGAGTRPSMSRMTIEG